MILRPAIKQDIASTARVIRGWCADTACIPLFHIHTRKNGHRFFDGQHNKESLPDIRYGWRAAS